MTIQKVVIARPKKKSQQLAFETWTEDRIRPNEFINRVRGRVELWRRGVHPVEKNPLDGPTSPRRFVYVH